MCQKCGKMKDYNKNYLHVLQNDYKHTGYDNNLKNICGHLLLDFILVDWHALN
jgi:hypothetical protein